MKEINLSNELGFLGKGISLELSKLSDTSIWIVRWVIRPSFPTEYYSRKVLVTRLEEGFG